MGVQTGSYYICSWLMVCIVQVGIITDATNFALFARYLLHCDIR